jgi:hypothetical protein
MCLYYDSWHFYVKYFFTIFFEDLIFSKIPSGTCIKKVSIFMKTSGDRNENRTRIKRLGNAYSFT